MNINIQGPEWLAWVLAAWVAASLISSAAKIAGLFMDHRRAASKVQTLMRRGMTREAAEVIAKGRNG